MTEQRIYWKTPEGVIGFERTTEHGYSDQGRTDDAVTISEDEYLDLRSAFEAEWVEAAEAAQEIADERLAGARASRGTAVAKLMNLGLTENEAQLIAGTPQGPSEVKRSVWWRP